MRIRLSCRLFLVIFSVQLMFLLLLTLKNYRILNIQDAELSNIEDSIVQVTKTNNDNGERVLKYILQWTSSKNMPLVFLGKGQEVFIERKCRYNNCFVTSDKELLGDYTKFDLIAFGGPEVVRMTRGRLPKRRSPHQKYVFATIESSDNYPVCSDNLNNFFNWTWTFKLDSEAKWGYMIIKDKNNNVIGPRKDMNWIKFEDMDPVSEEFKDKLKSKTIAAAWFVSNCHSKSKREKFVKELQKELKKYNLTVDVYGSCGTLKCSRANEEECYNMLKEKYYFYLSFENSFSEDYVTEKLLTAVEHDHNVVPIVFGAANYTRFMPDGMYLNARELGVEELAAKMDYLVRNPDEYAEYFRWKKYYSYFRMWEHVDTDEYCSFCTILNNEEKVKEISIYRNFREWWDPPGRC